MRGLVLCVLVAACYHEPTSGPPAHNAAPRLQQPSYAAALADPLGFLPVDSELVFAIDGRLVRNSGLWRRYSPNLLAKLAPELDYLKRTCDFDPIGSITQISFGVRDLDADHRSGVLVIHGLDRTKFLACVAHRPPDANVTMQGDTFVKRGEAGKDDVAVRFVAEHTGVMLLGPGADQRAMQAVLDAGSPLRTSPAFTQLFERVDTHQAIWLVVNGNAKVFDKMTSLGFRPHAAYAWFALTDGIAMTVHVVLDSAPQAQQLAAAAQGQLAVVKPMVDAIDLVAEDIDLVLTVALSDAKVQALVGLGSGLFP